MDLGLADRTALVCASTSGLGRATAAALAAEGARVVVTGRGRERAEAVAAELPNAIGIGVDLVSSGGADRLLTAVEAALGIPDVLVLNGPGPAPGSALDTDAAGIDTAVATLIQPQVALVRGILPSLLERGWGRILSISSTSIEAPIGDLTLSNLGRAGLAGYLKTLATEVAGRGVTVNSLLPGTIATPRAEQINEATARATGRTPAEVAAEGAASIPAGRYGRPEEFGAAAAFLCSAQASYITGTALRCDGGAVPTL